MRRARTTDAIVAAAVEVLVERARQRVPCINPGVVPTCLRRLPRQTQDQRFPTVTHPRHRSAAVAAPDHCAHKFVDSSGQFFQVSVIDPAGLDAPRQIPNGRHPIARRRRPPHRLDFDLPSVMLDDCDRLDALDVALDNLHRSQPVGCGPAPFGCPRPAGRGTPLRHATADLNNDRPATPAALQDLPRRPRGLPRNRPITCLLDRRFHSLITSQRNDATPRMHEVCLTLLEHESWARRAVNGEPF